VPAGRHQAATDKCAVGQGVKKQQFAHGVAKQHRGLLGDRLTAGATHGGKPLLHAALKRRAKALLMTGHQNQQCIGIVRQQLAMSCQHHVVFTFVGTGGDPDRTLAGAPLFTQGGGAGRQLRVDAQVELDRAGHFHGFRPCAQAAKTFGLCLGLYREQAHFCQHRRRQLGKSRIPFGRTRGQPRIGQRHRDTALGAGMDMVGPQLGFHDHRQRRLHAVEKTLGGAGQVVRQIAVLDARFVGK